MPNGGNPEECRRAAPFYEGIKSELTAFAAKHGFEYISWYHEAPVFMMEWRDKQDIEHSGQITNVNVSHEEAKVIADALNKEIRPPMI